MAKRIVFLGSKPVGYHCLAYLLAQAGSWGAEVIAVRTQKRKEFGDGHDLEALASDHGLPLLQSLDELPDCDIICSVQHHELLKAHHISRAGQIAVNLHLAPLPEYRGCNQFSFAIMDEAKEFGATLHRMDTRIDHGDILFEERFSIPPGCWVSDLYDLTAEAGVKLFRSAIKAVVTGDYQLVPQQALVAGRGTSIHYRHEIQELRHIHLDAPAAYIEKAIRATSMPGFEPPYTFVGGKKVFLSVAEHVAGS